MQRIPPLISALPKLRISTILANTNLDTRGRLQAVHNYIVTNETLMGSQFVVTTDDRVPYLIVAHTREVLPMPPLGKGGDSIHSYFTSMYGIDRTQPVMKAAYTTLRDWACREGIPVEMRRFSAYNAETSTAYITTYDGGMWRIDGENVERVTNGTDGVFFIDDDGGTPPQDDVDIGPHGLLFEHHTKLHFAPEGLGGITAEQQRMQWIVWMFALAFPDLIINKPLALIEGVKGSGKTSAVQLLQLMLMGRHNTMSISDDQAADFGVLLLRSPIGLLDNVDTYLGWLADKIAGYCTGATFSKRKLFTDAEVVSIRPHSFPVVSTRNPASFRRDDVVDRLIIFRLNRYIGFKRFEQLVALTRELRGKLFGEYLYYVKQIVEAIRNGAYDSGRIEVYRMADYAGFTRVVGGVMGWSEKDVDDLLDAMQEERDAFAAEDDPLPEMLRWWVPYKNTGQPRPNAGRAITVRALFHDLSSQAKANNIHFFGSAGSMQKALDSAHIAKEFRIEASIENRQRVYRIWFRNQPQLASIPMPQQRKEPVFRSRVANAKPEETEEE